MLSFDTTELDGLFIANRNPLIGIEWPLTATNISVRDMGHELLNKSFKGI